MFARDELLRLIKSKVHHPATARELAQLLKVPREERSSFKKQIRAMAASGDSFNTSSRPIVAPPQGRSTIQGSTQHAAVFPKM